jgi:hypothetical protein
MVHKFVAECAICQQAKTEKVKYPELLQPFTWQVVTLDFIEGLPCSKNYNCILVVVEKLSKYAHFVALSLPFTAFKVAMLYMDNIYKLHGLPQVLISDRDRIC